MSIRKTTRKSLKNIAEDESLPCCENNKKCPTKARRLLKKRLFKQNTDFYIQSILNEQEKQLHGVVKQCISFGESNSVLVIGPRGSGKSKLVDQVLSNVTNGIGDDYFYVYLNGIIHTDDKTALQDMARQLKLENVIGDRVFGSFADNLAFILDALKQDAGQSKSIVVVIDEFDLFTTHKNQSLLYNLFDISQSRQNPLCVIGITCRLDVVELLEKRVRSRYSHRSILTFPDYELETYCDIFRDFLQLPDSFECVKFKIRWNKHVENLLDDAQVRRLLENHFKIRKDVGNLIKLLTLPVSNITSSHCYITYQDMTSSYEQLHRDSKAVLLSGLSILELCLVIAAKHVLERRNGQPFNFEMIYNEYQNFSRRRIQGMQMFNKAVTFKAYEHLIALELVKSLEIISQNNLAKEYKPMCMLIDNSQIIETLKTFPDCPTEIANWGEYSYT